MDNVPSSQLQLEFVPALAGFLLVERENRELMIGHWN